MGPLLVHRVEEVIVILAVFQFIEQELHCIRRAHRRQDTAQDPHFRQCPGVDQQLFLPRSGFLNIDGWERALVGKFAIEHDFRITRALELFEDDFVHPAASINQSRRDDRHRTAFLDISRRTEESLGAL